MDANLTPVAAHELVADPSAGAPRSAFSQLAQMPSRAKAGAALGVAGLLAVIVALLLWSQSANLAPLYPNGMSDKDAAPVLDQLRQMGVTAKARDDGVIMVPAGQVAELRMRLSQAGLPKSAPVGFALLDNAKFGQSQLQERAQLQRALGDEIARSIAQLASVESARVLLAMPAANGFYREQQRPSASVVVTLRAGHTLDRGQIAGIVHLVSSSVADLSPKAVTVLDQNGQPLAGTGEGNPQQGLDSQQLQYVQQIESTHLKRVIEILEPALGRDNLRATVTAEVDFTQQESTSEAFKPNQSGEATLRSQRTTESNNAATATPTGVPGAASNQPPAPATAQTTGGTAGLQPSMLAATGAGARRENIVNYEVDKVVSVKRNATGTIKRIAAAVLVNHRVVTDAKGKTTATPLSPEEIDKLTALVQESIGFNKERGDSVKVVNIPFRTEAPAKPEALPAWKQPWLGEFARSAAVPFAALAMALLLVFGVVRPALRQARPSEPARAPRLDAVVGDPQRLPEPTVAAPLALEAQRSNKALEDARNLAQQNPAAVANIVRGWVSGEAA